MFFLGQLNIDRNIIYIIFKTSVISEDISPEGPSALNVMLQKAPIVNVGVNQKARRAKT